MNLDINPEKILFLDIETVAQKATYQELEEDFKALWKRKTKYLQQSESDTPETLYDRAGIFAEFGKIVCISYGFLNKKDAVYQFRIKSNFGKDEKKLLQEFSALLEEPSISNGFLLCAHNGKEFDFPYLARRILINGLPLPNILRIAGKKPWEVNHLDTMDLWKFGDFKNYTSLELLSRVFNIPTPKDDISGGEVNKVFWMEDNLDRIVQYCQKDVLTVARLLMKIAGLPSIEDRDVVLIS